MAGWRRVKSDAAFTSSFTDCPRVSLEKSSISIGCAADQPGQLWGGLIESVGRGFGGIGDVPDEVRAGGDLLVQQAFRLLSGLRRERGDTCLAWLTAS